MGAALGAKLAAPDKFVVATLGDGAYMFANPMVAHWVSDVHKLPILTIVFNNSLYGAVRGATMSMFKDGVAGEDGGRFMADLSPSPAFEAAVKAQGGHGERVEKAAGPARGARPRHRRGDEREAPGAAQRDLPAVTCAHLSPLAGRAERRRAGPNEHPLDKSRTAALNKHRPWEEKPHDHARRRLHPFHSEPLLQGGDVGRLAQGHRQADDGRAGDLRPQRPQEGGRQVQGLQPDPVLPDAAVRADDQEPGKQTEEYAKIVNDGFAELCAKDPDHFPGWVAQAPMAAPDVGVREAARAMKMGALGVQIYTNVAGRPLDNPEFEPFWKAMNKTKTPIWLHPSRTASFSGLPERDQIEVRNLVDARLVLRDRRGDVAAGVLQDHGPLSEAEDHHPPHGRHRADARRPHRPGLGPDRRAHLRRGLCRS